MLCDNCGNQNAHRIRLYEKGGQFCDKCGATGHYYVPDVYFDGRPEENLADDPETGKPRVFFSKGEKGRYLQERGLMEAGDRVHGAPVSFSQNQNRKAVESRNEVKEALRKVREMSPDRRHQAYLRITKDGAGR